jgi:hypothetical protein
MVSIDSGRIIRLRSAGLSWSEIAQETGLDPGDGAASLLCAESLSPLAQKRLAWFWASHPDSGQDFRALTLRI